MAAEAGPNGHRFALPLVHCAGSIPWPQMWLHLVTLPPDGPF